MKSEHVNMHIKSLADKKKKGFIVLQQHHTSTRTKRAGKNSWNDKEETRRRYTLTTIQY